MNKDDGFYLVFGYLMWEGLKIVGFMWLWLWSFRALVSSEWFRKLGQK